MNLRIRELYQQAHSNRSWQGDPMREGEFGPGELNAEKFAELIVLETLRVTGATLSQHETAKKCFGVEE